MKKLIGTVLLTLGVSSAAMSQEGRIVLKDSMAIPQIESKLGVNDSLLNDSNVFYIKENNKHNFKDYKNATKIDSLWREELYSSALFDTIYKDITTQNLDNEVIKVVSTEVLKERLASLNARTPFNVEYNPSLERVINSYLKRRQSSLERLMTISQYYFPMFETELDNYDIPLEMKYLAIVESALNPRAKSPVGAGGLWQFMYTTGKMYNLDVNSYVDERNDPLSATKAACQYLAKLYKIFGDWDLALAAYNSGPGNVNKAIRRSGGRKNYWNLRPHLPRETAGYVPAFLATMYLFEYAKEHNFKPKRVANPYFETDTIRVKSLVTFDHISELVNIPVEDLQLLNPSYRLDIIPFIKEKNYVLRLPLDKIGVFVANEDAIYKAVNAELAQREKPLPKFFKNGSRVRYRVRSGDFLGKIANKYGVRVSQIKRWNGLRNNNLRIGQRLTIHPRKPVGTVVASKKKKSKVKASPSTYKGSVKKYVVQEGDSLWVISRKFPGISIENLKEWNSISGTGIKPGLTLKLCNC